MWYFPDSFISDVMGMGTVKVKMLDGVVSTQAGVAKLDGIAQFGWCGISPKDTKQSNILGPLGFQGL